MVLPPHFLVLMCTDKIFKNKVFRWCALHPLGPSENQHPVPCFAWGPASSSLWFQWDKDQVLEAEAPISTHSVVGLWTRGFAEHPEPLHPSERAQSELALHNPADKTVLGSHTITTRIPTSQPTCV